MSLSLRRLANTPTILTTLALVAALVLATVPTSNASHFGTGGADAIIDVTVQTDAYWNGSYLGVVNPTASPSGLQIRAFRSYEMTFTNVTPSNGTSAELVAPGGAVAAAASPYATGYNASVKNVTFLITSSALTAGGIYQLRETSSGAIKGAIYVAPQLVALTISPNPITYTGGSYVITYTSIGNATLIGPCIPSPAQTDPSGNFTAVQSCPGVGTHTVTVRKQTSNQTTNGVDVPEYDGFGTYSVVQATPKISIGNVSGSILYSVQAPIRLENITDFGAATVKLTFDPSVVEVLDVSNSTIPNATLTWDVNETAGVMTVLVTTTARPGANGTFTLASVKLRAVGSAGSTTPLDLSIQELVDSDGDNITATAIDGSFRAGILGDADGDGDIDQDDVLAISEVVVGKRSASTIIAADADVSKDGVLTGKDAMYLSQHLAGTRPTL